MIFRCNEWRSCVSATIETMASLFTFLVRFATSLAFRIIFDERTQMCHIDDRCKSSNDKLTIFI